MNKEIKCCEKCFGSISGLQWWCNNPSCPCHTQESKFECNCGYEELTARWHSPDCSIFYKTPITTQESKEEIEFLKKAQPIDLPQEPMEEQIPDKIECECDYQKENKHEKDCPVFPQEPMEWESEFDKKFVSKEFQGQDDNLDCYDLFSGGKKVKELKQFISSQIKQAEERVKEECRKAQGTCDKVFEEYIQPYVDKKVKEERERCKKIVNQETPRHFTRDYKETDSMRDRIINLINQNNE